MTVWWLAGGAVWLVASVLVAVAVGRIARLGRHPDDD